MSDFITRLEVDLLDAAGRLHTSQDSTQAAGRTRGRLGRYRLLAAGLAVLVVAAPALAGVPGIWHGVFAGPDRRPTLTSEQPDPQLFAELGVLRRPATASDQSPQALAAIEHSGPLDGVSARSVRYVGISPVGDPLFLVPYRSRVRLTAPQESDTAGPAPLRMLGSRPDTSGRSRVSVTRQRAQRANLQRFLNQPGVCLIAVATGTPEIEDCAASSEIAAGTDYTTVGVDRTHPETSPALPSRTNPPHVIATVASGIVPDGVARVELSFDRRSKRTLAVRNNYFAFIVGRGEGSVPAITWLGQDGRVLRQIPAG